MARLCYLQRVNSSSHSACSNERSQFGPKGRPSHLIEIKLATNLADGCIDQVFLGAWIPERTKDKLDVHQ